MPCEPTHTWRYLRAANIALRTAHLCATGIVAGGHVFDVGPERILSWTWPAILTGVALMIVEGFPGWRYVCEGRGALVIGKLLLLCLIPWLWHARVPLLVAVIIMGSVGSHMPWKYRHFSFLPDRAGKPQLPPD
jgi:hypothetical protein